MKVFPVTHTLELVPNAAEILYVLGFIVALFMWSFAIVWFFLASAMVIQSRGFPFSMGWWSFTFPIGVFALSTMTIGNAIGSSFFKVLGTVSHLHRFVKIANADQMNRF
jgi:tellurite resistance protein TehA-like permease